MLKGFFDTVPRELEEAALLDGCTLVVFRRIVLPLSLPAEVVGIERLGGESVYHLAVAGHSIKALWRREDIASPHVDLAVESAVVFARTA